VVLVALVLIFHIDIRRAFERLATWEPFQKKTTAPTARRMIDTIAESAFTLAEKRMGALLALTGKESLERHIRGGISLNGSLSMPLITSIFDSSSPGHDGAVIIEDSKIEKFGAHLPLSANLTEVGVAGTRHAAGLGLSERCDALVIIVSEERGQVSVAYKGRLARLSSAAELLQRLETFYAEAFAPQHANGRWRMVTKDIHLKGVAVLLATVVWLLLGYRVETLHRTFMAPVEFRNLADSWVIEDPRPTTVRVSLSGSQREFDFSAGDLVFALDMSNVREGVQSMFITRDKLVKPPGLSVHQIQPNVIKFRAYKMSSIEAPVKAALEGNLPEGLELQGVELVPSKVRLLVRESQRTELGKIMTEPVNLAGIDSVRTVKAKLVIPEFARVPEGAPTDVTVKIRVAPVARRDG